MTNFFARQGAAYINEMNRSLAALLGIATGILADHQIADAEIRFLNDWLESNSAIATSWPGDVIHARIREVLADGMITAAERDHLMETLQQLIGGTLEELASTTHVTKLAFDDVREIQFQDAHFCLTGEFVFAPRNICAREIETRGGFVKGAVSKKLRYLVIGGLGSPEWKHGRAVGRKSAAPSAVCARMWIPARRLSIAVFRHKVIWLDCIGMNWL